MVIYADVLLIVNWWVDFLLLTGVAKLTGGVPRGWRLALGGLAGGLSSFLIFLPSCPWWLGMVGKCVPAGVMVWVTFGKSPWRLWGKRLLWLFALSVATAGICQAVYSLLAPTGLYVDNGVVYYAVEPVWLVVLTGVCYLLIRLSGRILPTRSHDGTRCTVTVMREGRSVSFPCLYDTGNHLKEPFSGCPVIVAERQVFPDWEKMPVSAQTLPAGWRAIPFSTVEGEGLLPAFSGTRVAVAFPRKTVVIPRCYIALCQPLENGEYRGLVGTAVDEWC